ncbi:hypothetical protein M501DRAFT_989922 [Patellaria atrata CBS 101060]|uniref:Uncharacterized protein n=1 Tax=Patellaria atrata CBS 101060 TaxID=1346257 RepID=A0A9P4SEM0_9PEZI|nr:hypothetical protein M501DRAFT_989922 [Patellaria atrata CBS 101060]
MCLGRIQENKRQPLILPNSQSSSNATMDQEMAEALVPEVKQIGGRDDPGVHLPPCSETHKSEAKVTEAVATALMQSNAAPGVLAQSSTTLIKGRSGFEMRRVRKPRKQKVNRAPMASIANVHSARVAKMEGKATKTEKKQQIKSEGMKRAKEELHTRFGSAQDILMISGKDINALNLGLDSKQEKQIKQYMCIVAAGIRRVVQEGDPPEVCQEKILKAQERQEKKKKRHKQDIKDVKEDITALKEDNMRHGLGEENISQRKKRWNHREKEIRKSTTGSMSNALIQSTNPAIELESNSTMTTMAGNIEGVPHPNPSGADLHISFNSLMGSMNNLFISSDEEEASLVDDSEMTGVSLAGFI